MGGRYKGRARNKRGAQPEPPENTALGKSLTQRFGKNLVALRKEIFVLISPVLEKLHFIK